MGWDPSKGLGKRGDGILQPISAYEKISYKAGIGSEINIEKKKHTYKAIPIDIIVKTSWAPILTTNQTEFDFEINHAFHINKEFDTDSNDSNYNIIYNKITLEQWLTVKKRVDKVGIEWDNTFCEIGLQKEMFAAKTQFDDIGQSNQFRDARNRSNPFESIKKEIFQNRAALKMCEIDVALDYEITRPKCCVTFNNQRRKIQEQKIDDWKQRKLDKFEINSDDKMWTRECIYFADICAGPGFVILYLYNILV